MILKELSEDTKQYNIKLYTSVIEYIEEYSQKHNTSASNVIRHALNLMRGLDAMNAEIEYIDQMYYIELNELDITLDQELEIADDRAEVNETTVDHEEWQEYMNDRKQELEEKYTRFGYAIREKYSYLLKYIPVIPKAPIDTTIPF